MSDFQQYGLHHLLAVIGSGLAAAWWISLGLRAQRRGGDASVRAFGAGVMLASQCVMQLYWCLPSRFDLYYSLPLHACDLGAFLSPVAVVLAWRPLRVLMLFWGLSFASQAFLQPTLVDGPDSIQFYFYWLNHLIGVAAALWFVLVDRVRPTLKETFASIGATAAWVLVMFLVNSGTGWNYMFVGPGKPDQATVLDALGPWPRRVPIIMAIGSALFVAIWAILLVTCGNARHRGHQADPRRPASQ